MPHREVVLELRLRAIESAAQANRTRIEAARKAARAMAGGGGP